MAMPLNMILIVYVIPCILPYDFNKLTILYIHVLAPTYIYLFHLYDKLVCSDFFAVNKKISVCLSYLGVLD